MSFVLAMMSKARQYLATRPVSYVVNWMGFGGAVSQRGNCFKYFVVRGCWWLTASCRWTWKHLSLHGGDIREYVRAYHQPTLIQRLPVLPVLPERRTTEAKYLVSLLDAVHSLYHCRLGPRPMLVQAEISMLGCQLATHDEALVDEWVCKVLVV